MSQKNHSKDTCQFTPLDLNLVQRQASELRAQELRKIAKKIKAQFKALIATLFYRSKKA